MGRPERRRLCVMPRLEHHRGPRVSAAPPGAVDALELLLVAEQTIKNLLAELAPGIPFLGEEGGGVVDVSGAHWVLSWRQVPSTSRAEGWVPAPATKSNASPRTSRSRRSQPQHGERAVMAEMRPESGGT